jgi:general secretion pathway protein B
MSYILDAIKKSEAERNLGVSPGALAAPMPASGSTTSLRIATVIVMLNVAALGGWWLWQERAAGIVETTVAVPALSRAIPSSARDAAPRSIDQPSQALVYLPTPIATSVATPIATSVANAKPIPAPEPRSVAALPEFSTHVFADDPQLRAVTLDGRRLTEGELIGPGMRLLEITESGVVLDFNGERIEFDVLQDWRS